MAGCIRCAIFAHPHAKHRKERKVISLNTTYGKLSGKSLAIFACAESATRYSLAVFAKDLLNMRRTPLYCATKSIIEFDREFGRLSHSIQDAAK